MKILALEPYYGGSHEAFLDGLVANSSHEFRTITMADRFWKWRMQGGAVTLARKGMEYWEDGFEPDLILATDMVNLPAFMALTRPHFSSTPVVLYFHENQLTYPLPEDQSRDYTYGYINYLSCLAADRAVFNSQFHYDGFTGALPELLRLFPDYTHLETVQQIRDNSEVLHLGIDLKSLDHPRFNFNRSQVWETRQNGPVILWNQRWEYDKNPEQFFRVMNRLDDAGCSFRLILAGEHFEEQPYEFEQAWQRYGSRILHYGYAEDRQQYSRLLHQADLVVSTALHEFFGIAIMEAIYCGCHPVLPNRLTYPELVPENLHKPLLHAPILYDDEENLFEVLRALLDGDERPLPPERLRQIPENLNWKVKSAEYDELFDRVKQEAEEKLADDNGSRIGLGLEATMRS
jgi:glycosyltransferase involved in cell wall biosynthesis